ncbi:MAG: monovalent cation/H(+) antiporter subunit G [Planctomycetota bacterium]
MILALDSLSILLLSAGFFFFFATAVGLIRFPDFYCRMHAAGKGDTLSTMLMMMGLALFQSYPFSGEAFLVSLKIMFIAVFIFMSSPTASHAILDAGYKTGEPMWKKENSQNKNEESDHDLAV